MRQIRNGKRNLERDFLICSVLELGKKALFEEQGRSIEYIFLAVAFLVPKSKCNWSYRKMAIGFPIVVPWLVLMLAFVASQSNSNSGKSCTYILNIYILLLIFLSISHFNPFLHVMTHNVRKISPKLSLSLFVWVLWLEHQQKVELLL